MHPTRRLLALFGAGFPTALLPALVDASLWRFWIGFVAYVGIAATLDGLVALRSSRLERRIVVPSRLLLGEPGVAVVHLRAAGRRGIPIDVHLDLSPDLEPVEPRRVTLGAPSGGEEAIPADGWVTATFPLRAARRGTVRVEAVWLRWTGPFRLVARTVRDRHDDRVAVVPDVGSARRAALRHLARRESSVGLRPVVGLGEGSEFESMRDHAAGMDTRAISWRASARHRRLVSHEFRAERNHQVIVAVDTGRLMAEPIRGVPKIDHAVLLGLRLAHAALRLGDRVGMYAFDERVRGFVPPRGGLRHDHRLERFGAELEYGTGETNFTLGLAELAVRLRRRSLVVIFTDFVDTITADLMVRNTAHLARRHVVAFVALRDPALEEARTARPGTLEDVYRAVVAGDLHRERQGVCLRLERRGVFVLDAPPERAGEPLLDRYLHVKRREMVG